MLRSPWVPSPFVYCSIVLFYRQEKISCMKSKIFLLFYDFSCIFMTDSAISDTCSDLYVNKEQIHSSKARKIQTARPIRDYEKAPVQNKPLFCADALIFLREGVGRRTGASSRMHRCVNSEPQSHHAQYPCRPARQKASQCPPEERKCLLKN